jgi:hypothetical protein
LSRKRFKETKKTIIIIIIIIIVMLPLEEASVHLKLSLATATIVAGHVCRRLEVVSRENGESMLALIFGILLPSLLVQV